MNYASPLSPLAGLAYGLTGLVGILVLMACWTVAIALTNRLVRDEGQPPGEQSNAASAPPAADAGLIADGR